MPQLRERIKSDKKKLEALTEVEDTKEEKATEEKATEEKATEEKDQSQKRKTDDILGKKYS